MIFGGPCLCASALASATPLAASTTDTASTYPITTLLRNVHVRGQVNPGLSGEETAGEVGTITLTFPNPDLIPEVGDPVEVRFISEVLFSGTITDIERTIDPSHSLTLYTCTATDWGQVLVRRKVRRSFTDLTLPQLISSLLENELGGEGFVYGSSDNQGLMELVDADNVSVFDVLRDVAGITGQVLYVDYDKTIRFRATSNVTAPFAVADATVADVSQRVDRETYRNVQTVIAHGTPPQGTDAIEVQVTLTNDEQIAERAAIEGGSGRYEQIDEVTHPSSNTQTIVARLAETYATVLLAVGGTPRRTLKARMKKSGLYGFRAGQIAPVDLTGLGLSGTWLIQKVSWSEEDGSRLLYNLELVESSLQQRAWESWASIYRDGQLVVTVPGAGLSANIASYTTPGSYQWVSAIAGTITITTMGGSASGGGAANLYFSNPDGTIDDTALGGKGGNSGKTVSNVSVAIGDVLDITVGAKGTPGGTSVTQGTVPVNGGFGVAGTASQVLRSGVVLSKADGGGRGGRGVILGDITNGAAGTPGGGSDGIVTVGGGKTGGAGGYGSHFAMVNGKAGQDGSVTIEY